MKVLNRYGITKKENGVENVRNSKVSQEEDKLIQQKLQEAFGYTGEQLAAQLDQAAAEYAAHPELNLTEKDHLANFAKQSFLFCIVLISFLIHH